MYARDSKHSMAIEYAAQWHKQGQRKLQCTLSRSAQDGCVGGAWKTLQYIALYRIRGALRSSSHAFSKVYDERPQFVLVSRCCKDTLNTRCEKGKSTTHSHVWTRAFKWTMTVASLFQPSNICGSCVHVGLYNATWCARSFPRDWMRNFNSSVDLCIAWIWRNQVLISAWRASLAVVPEAIKTRTAGARTCLYRRLLNSHSALSGAVIL